MEVALAEVLTAHAALSELKGRRLPAASVSLPLVRLHRALAGHVEDHNQVLSGIIQEYGEKNEDGMLVRSEDGGIKIRDDVDADEVNAAINNLQDQPVEVGLEPLPASIFEELDVEWDVLSDLGPFIALDS